MSLANWLKKSYIFPYICLFLITKATNSSTIVSEIQVHETIYMVKYTIEKNKNVQCEHMHGAGNLLQINKWNSSSPSPLFSTPSNNTSSAPNHSLTRNALQNASDMCRRKGADKKLKAILIETRVSNTKEVGAKRHSWEKKCSHNQNI